MEILTTILIGLIVGLLARFFVSGPQPMGFLLTTVLGIIGAIFGSWIGQLAGFYARGEPAGFIMSVIGAVVVLLLFRWVKRKQYV